jgi:hypothetical protein
MQVTGSNSPGRAVSKHVLNPDGQFPPAPACSVEDGVGDSWCHACHRDFAQALRASAVKLEVRLIDKLHLDGTDVGIHRDHVFSKICI